MDTGVGFFATHDAMRPAPLAPLVEDHGQTALYFPEHSHIPASRETDPRTRMKLMRERIEAMQAIWTTDEASYHGEHVAFDRIWCWPKPAQRPYPPVLVGGNGPTVLDRVLAFGDVWFPNWAPDVLDRIPELRARAQDAGRSIPVYLVGVPADAATLARCGDAGVARVVHWLPSANRSVEERALERWEAAFAEIVVA